MLLPKNIREYAASKAMNKPGPTSRYDDRHRQAYVHYEILFALRCKGNEHYKAYTWAIALHERHAREELPSLFDLF
jgi:hypothetical protein